MRDAHGGRPSAEPRIRILIADRDHRVRQALRDLLEADGSCLVVGEAAGAVQLSAMLPATQPTVIVLDLLLPTIQDGLRAVRRLARQRGPAIIVLSNVVTSRDAALAAGARLFLEKSLDPDRLRQAIAEVAALASDLTLADPMA